VLVDARLSANGRAQAEAIRGHAALLDPLPELVLSSPLSRAMSTAIAFNDCTEVAGGRGAALAPLELEALCREQLENSCDVGRSPAVLAAEPEFAAVLRSVPGAAGVGVRSLQLTPEKNAPPTTPAAAAASARVAVAAARPRAEPAEPPESPEPPEPAAATGAAGALQEGWWGALPGAGGDASEAAALARLQAGEMEPAVDVARRCHMLLGRIAARPERSVVLVSHCMFLRALEAAVEDAVGVVAAEQVEGGQESGAGGLLCDGHGAGGGGGGGGATGGGGGGDVDGYRYLANAEVRTLRVPGAVMAKFGDPL
jgi:broad specificity phosphatase PhoE